MKQLTVPAIVVAMIACILFSKPRCQYALAASASPEEPVDSCVVDSTCVDGGMLDSALVAFRWPTGSGEHLGYSKEEVIYLASSSESHESGWSIGGGVSGGGSGFGGNIEGGYSSGGTVTNNYEHIMCCMPVGGKCNFDYENPKCAELFMP